MELAHYSVGELKEQILGILGKHLDLSKCRVFFFGSRVDGTGSERSDIDVGIEAPEPIPSVAMLDIQEEIENLPTLYKIEVVDFHNVTPKFRKVALQNIELINTP